MFDLFDELIEVFVVCFDVGFEKGVCFLCFCGEVVCEFVVVSEVEVDDVVCVGVVLLIG